MKSKEDLKRAALEKTLREFDFEKVRKAVVAVGWNVNTRPQIADDSSPSVEEMKLIARDLLEKAWDDEQAPNCEYCHGGLCASRTGGCLTLQFVIEESYFVAAVDVADEEPPSAR